jgi:hypothetical protein
MEHIKMSQREQYLSYVYEFLAKYGAWFAYVAIGLVGKFGWDIVSGKKISWWYIFGTGCMAAFVGFVSSKWFINNNPEMGAYLVPVLTLASRDVLLLIKMIDWHKVIGAFLRVEIKKKED